MRARATLLLTLKLATHVLISLGLGTKMRGDRQGYNTPAASLPAPPSAYQVYKASSREPDADECGDKVYETNTITCLEDVQILQDVRCRHQTQYTSEPQSYRHGVTSSSSVTSTVDNIQACDSDTYTLLQHTYIIM